MKLASDSLFLLIKSLHKNEKRYFKLFAGLYMGKKQSHNLSLFNILDKMSAYDESVLSKKLLRSLPEQDQDVIKSLPTLKKYLYDSILKSLRNYYSNKKGDLNNFSRCTEINILIKKHLFHQAMKLYKQTKKELEIQGEYPLLIKLTYIGEKLWFCFTSESIRKKKLVELLNERDEYVQLFQNETTYTKILHQVSNVLEKHAPLRNKEDEDHVLTYLEQPELKNYDLALTRRSKLLYYCSHLIVAEWTYDYFKGYEFSQKCAADLFQKPEKISHTEFYFYSMYMNYYLLNTGLLLIKDEFAKKQTELKSVFERLEKDLTIMDKARYYASYYYGMFFGLGLEGEHETIMSKKDEVNTILEEYGDVMESYQKQAFYFSFARASFYLQDYESTLFWTEKILAYEKENPIDSLLCMSRMLNIMVHFELKNYTLLNSMILSTQRYLQKRKSLYNSEKIILRHLKKMSDTNDMKKVLVDFRDDLNNAFINKYEIMFLGILAIGVWIGEKLETAKVENFNIPELESVGEIKDLHKTIPSNV